MAAVDYLDRKFDVLAFQGGEIGGDRQLSQALFSQDDGGAVCTGIQKLAQRWLLEFLTRRGSMGFHLSNRGSDFLRWADRGVFRTEFDVQSYFNFSAQQVKSNLVNEEPEEMPDDERISHATLDRILLADGQMQLQVTVISLAGDSRKVILPISLTPVNLTV